MSVCSRGHIFLLLEILVIIIYYKLYMSNYSESRSNFWASVSHTSDFLSAGAGDPDGVTDGVGAGAGAGAGASGWGGMVNVRFVTGSTTDSPGCQLPISISDACPLASRYGDLTNQGLSFIHVPFLVFCSFGASCVGEVFFWSLVGVSSVVGILFTICSHFTWRNWDIHATLSSAETE